MYGKFRRQTYKATGGTGNDIFSRTPCVHFAEFWGFCVYCVGHCWFVCSFSSLLWYRLERAKNKGYIITTMCDKEQRTMSIKLTPCVTENKEQGLHNCRHGWHIPKNKGYTITVMYDKEQRTRASVWTDMSCTHCSFSSLLWYRLESQCKYNVIHTHLCTGQLDFKAPSIVCDCFNSLFFHALLAYSYVYMTCPMCDKEQRIRAI
jgi:hypothetical protein